MPDGKDRVLVARPRLDGRTALNAALCSVVGSFCLVAGVGSIASNPFFGGFLTIISLLVAVVVSALSLFVLRQSVELRGGDVGKDPR